MGKSIELEIQFFFSYEISVFWLVDTLLLDEFDWSIFLCDVTGSKLCWAFQVSQSRAKIIFWASCIGPPISQPIVVRFCSGKKKCLSKAIYCNKPTGNFLPNFPFKTSLCFNNLMEMLKMICSLLQFRFPGFAKSLLNFRLNSALSQQSFVWSEFRPWLQYPLI